MAQRRQHNIAGPRSINQQLATAPPPKGTAGGPARANIATLAAVRNVLAVMEHDLEIAPPRVQPLVAYIREHLFDPNLNVDGLKRACNVRSKWVLMLFRSALGEPPGVYIESRRMEAAKGLLVETDLSVWRIAQALGYSSIQVFSRGFGRWAGETASCYRRHRRLRMSPDSPAVKNAMAAARVALARHARITEERLRCLSPLVDDIGAPGRWEPLLQRCDDLMVRLQMLGVLEPEAPHLETGGVFLHDAHDAGGSS